MSRPRLNAWACAWLSLACSSPAGPETDASGGAPTTATGGVAGRDLGGSGGSAGTSHGPVGTSGAGAPGGGSAVGAGGGTNDGGAAPQGGGGVASGSGGVGGSGGSGGSGGVGDRGGGDGGVEACATSELASCSGTNPIRCDFAGSTGDYQVTLELGAGEAYVDAESYRRMLGVTKLATGETRRFSFGVNVRQPEGQPVQDVPAGTPGLQVYVRGSSAKLSSICHRSLTPAPKVWIAGDSTVCDQDGTDYAGWAQHLPQHFRSPVVVANYADSGESSTSVLDSAKMWGAIKAGWKAGDWVFVQVGHNDKNITSAAFKSNITAYATQAKAAGVNIVLCTPISRVGYALADEHQSSAGANLPQIVRDVAKEQNVPLLDLTVITWNWLDGLADWKPYFALGTDRTHPNPAGATAIAGLVRDAIREQKLGLAPYLR
jgi:lysophospholipase L1-like esterase